MTSAASAALCQAFRAARAAADGSEAAPGTDPDPDDDAVLAGVLTAALDRATAAWPTLAHDPAAFAAHLGQRVPSDLPAADALRGRATDELYLVSACLTGEPTAVGLLEQRYLHDLGGLLARQGIPADLAADTVQQLRMRLLTGERPLLQAYSGLGALRGWLRVTALRDAIRARRREPRVEGEDAAAALADATADPGLQYQRRLYQAEFRTAFGAAVARLSVRERNLLKQSVLYGATIDDLGALYQVHRATAARWLAAARERLAVETRELMIAQLGIPAAEYDSLLQLIHSQLDVSVSRVLG